MSAEGRQVMYGRRSRSATPSERRNSNGDEGRVLQSPGGTLYSSILPVTMEQSGYSHNGRFNLLEDMDFQSREPPHPMIARRIRQADPVEGENDCRGPNKFSTSTGAGVGAGQGFYVDPNAPRRVTGRMEASGFTTNHLSWRETEILPDEEEERERLGIKLHKWELGGTSKKSNMKNSFNPPPLHVDYGDKYATMHAPARTRPKDPMDLNYYTNARMEKTAEQVLSPTKLRNSQHN